jgi:hypothetical protein
LIPHRLFQPLIVSHVNLADHIGGGVSGVTFHRSDIAEGREDELMLGFLHLQGLETHVQGAARLLQKPDAPFGFFLEQINVRLRSIDLGAF